MATAGRRKAKVVVVEVKVEPAAPIVAPVPRSPVPPQTFIRRPVYRCTHCGSTNVRRNGGSPSTHAHFVCGRCTDDDGNWRTFKLPVSDAT